MKILTDFNGAVKMLKLISKDKTARFFCYTVLFVVRFLLSARCFMMGEFTTSYTLYDGRRNVVERGFFTYGIGDWRPPIDFPITASDSIRDDKGKLHSEENGQFITGTTPKVKEYEDLLTKHEGTKSYKRRIEKEKPTRGSGQLPDPRRLSEKPAQNSGSFPSRVSSSTDGKAACGQIISEEYEIVNINWIKYGES